MLFKIKNKFLFLAVIYVFFVLVGIFVLSYKWLPPGFAIVGHDSGLPLDAKQFLLTRLYAWDDRLDFGVDNSPNFGSLTIHFFDWLFSYIAGTPYAGNYLSVFFWLGLIFLSGFALSYSLRDRLGKPFVFILPVFLVFNFYIFQSVFMLERSKFGVFSATLITLAVFFRMRKREFSVVAAALISSLVFSIFNGGGWFGITLYGGVAVVLVALLVVGFASKVTRSNTHGLKETLLFVFLSLVFYIFFNAYSILPYVKNFLTNDAPRLLHESSASNNIEWLRYVSRSTSTLNLFRFLGVPDWYAGLNEIGKADPNHPYASSYLNNAGLVLLSFVFPLLTFGSLVLAKTKKQRRIICIFALIALLELVFTAGSHTPLGHLYEFLMNHVPGFFIFRSAFYKFGIFYLLGALVMFSFTISFLIERLAEVITIRSFLLFPKAGERSVNFTQTSLVFVLTVLSLGLWLGYHKVLLSSGKVFSWKSDETTKTRPPDYVFDFARSVSRNSLDGRRVLMLPPVNKDWLNDAYSWGYWSLSPLPFALSSIHVLSNWHALTGDEQRLVDGLYNAIKEKKEADFHKLADRVNVGYILLRNDVLVDSSWSAADRPETYKRNIETFASIGKPVEYGQWYLYPIRSTGPTQVYSIASINIAPEKLSLLVNEFFGGGHAIDYSVFKEYKEIGLLGQNRVELYDCLSCLLEKQAKLKSLPETIILPNSPLYYFKVEQEQKILKVPKDSKSKIADYLGFTLRRTAEWKTMIGLSVKEEYLIKNMEVMRSYLDKIYFELKFSQENTSDFETARQVLDYLSPIERELNDYLAGHDSKVRSNKFIDEVLGILWNTRQIKNFFNPILDDMDRWSKEKVYKINFPESGEYTLFFSSDSFPRSVDGGVILPKTIEFMRNGQTKTLEVKDGDNGWFLSGINYQDAGSAQLVLRFDELPDLLNSEGSVIVDFPNRKAACYRESIKNYDRSRPYTILVSKTDRLREAKVIIRDDAHVYSQKNNFLLGDDTFEVPTVGRGKFSTYTFRASVTTKIASLYICSNDTELPLIDKIGVREFFAPVVIGVKKPPIVENVGPDLEYKFINPTKYEGEIKHSDKPFILVFNEKFDPSWKLFLRNDRGGKTDVGSHFVVDGYANGWFIDQINTKEYGIEYAPQSLFYVGGIVSLTSLMVGAGWMAYSAYRARTKNRKDSKKVTG